MHLPLFPAKVDNFRPSPGVRHFFLSHFHTDHMQGITPSWDHGVIVCSNTTRLLVLEQYRVDPARVIGIAYDTPREIWCAPTAAPLTAAQDGAGPAAHSPSQQQPPVDSSTESLLASRRCVSLQVELWDAHHIPGSCMFLFDCVLEHSSTTSASSADGLVAGASGSPGETRLGEATCLSSSSTSRTTVRILYTGDYKVTEELLAKARAVTPAVDHVYTDTTWLHLEGVQKFLTHAELDQALAAVAKTLRLQTVEIAHHDPLPPSADGHVTDGQPSEAIVGAQASIRSNIANADEAADPADTRPSVGDPLPVPGPEEEETPEDDIGAGEETGLLAELLAEAEKLEEPSVASPTDAADRTHHAAPIAQDELRHHVAAGEEQEALLPRRENWFVLRCYLHNHFGKEQHLQRLAVTLDCPIVVDDRRFRYLREASVFCSDIDLNLFRHAQQMVPWHGVPPTAVRPVALPDSNEADDDVQGRSDDDASLGTPDGVDAHQSTTAQSDEGGAVDVRRSRSPSLPHSVKGGASAESPSVIEAALYPRRIEIVSSRAAIDPAALARLSADTGIPHFGVAMSGWARLQSRAKAVGTVGAERVWQIPFSLHSTAEEIEELVFCLNPRSVSPLDPGKRQEREATAAIQRLGKYLREPFRQRFCIPIATAGVVDDKARRAGRSNPNGFSVLSHGVSSHPAGSKRSREDDSQVPTVAVPSMVLPVPAGGSQRTLTQRDAVGRLAEATQHRATGVRFPEGSSEAFSPVSDRSPLDARTGQPHGSSDATSLALWPTAVSLRDRPCVPWASASNTVSTSSVSSSMQQLSTRLFEFAMSQ